MNSLYDAFVSIDINRSQYPRAFVGDMGIWVSIKITIEALGSREGGIVDEGGYTQYRCSCSKTKPFEEDQEERDYSEEPI